jgi:hypothetical protein
MYLGDVPSSPAWDAVAAIGAGGLRTMGYDAAEPFIQTAVREAATQRANAQNAGDSAALAILNDRLRRLAEYDAVVKGGAASGDFADIAATAPSGGLDLLGTLRTILVVGAVVAGVVLLLPTAVRTIGAARASHSF